MSAVTPSGFNKSKTFREAKAIYISLTWSQAGGTSATAHIQLKKEQVRKAAVCVRD